MVQQSNIAGLNTLRQHRAVQGPCSCHEIVGILGRLFKFEPDIAGLRSRYSKPCFRYDLRTRLWQDVLNQFFSLLQRSNPKLIIDTMLGKKTNCQ